MIFPVCYFSEQIGSHHVEKRARAKDTCSRCREKLKCPPTKKTFNPTNSKKKTNLRAAKSFFLFATSLNKEETFWISSCWKKSESKRHVLE
jgi:hypothetical protein